MRKIHITEAQLQYCLEQLNEAFNQGAGIKVAAKTDPSGKVTQTTLNQQNHELDNQGLNNAEIVVNQETLGEGYEVYTKAQLKEARRQKLINESDRLYSKKDISTVYSKNDFLSEATEKLAILREKCGNDFAKCSMPKKNADFWGKVMNEAKSYIKTDKTGKAKNIVSTINEMLSEIEVY